MANNKIQITESVYDIDFWDRLDLHVSSYVKSSLQLRYVSSKTRVIARALHQAILDLVGYISNNTINYTENETTVIGQEHRVVHSCDYTMKIKDGELNDIDDDDKIHIRISSIAPTIFARIRENLGISYDDFQKSFSECLKDFTNPGKSGSLMYKTFDDLFILKTLRDYEARLLIKILTGYQSHLAQRSTLFNRYLGLYCIRLDASISTIEIFVVIMANAFTSTLRINEIFDLKGSKIKRKLDGHFSPEKLHKLKDLDFIELYPNGIRLPTNIDFSLVLGIRHLDMKPDEMIQRRPMSSVATLLQTSSVFQLIRHTNTQPTPATETNMSSIITSYLKPIQLLGEKINMNLYYDDDCIAYASLPLPGIINHTNQRVYLYLALVDMLQTYDHFKVLDQTYRKLTDPDRHLEYSVIEPNEYEKRINQFLFEQVFTDAKNDFPWTPFDVNQQEKVEEEYSNTIIEFRV